MNALIPDSVTYQTDSITYTNLRPLPKNLENPLLVRTPIKRFTSKIGIFFFFTFPKYSYLLLWLTWPLKSLQVRSFLRCVQPSSRHVRWLKCPKFSSETHLPRNWSPTFEHWHRLFETPVVAHELIVMSSHHRQEVVVAHGHVSERQTPQREQVDGHTTSESASDAGNKHHAIVPSLEPPRSPLASKVERVPRYQTPYEDIVSMMKE